MCCFFNRNHPVYDLQIGHFDNRNRNVLTTGFESRRVKEQFLRSRWNISSQLSTQIGFVLGNRNSDSELFSNRDYSIDYQTISPTFTYLPSQQIETTFSYEYKMAHNVLEKTKATAEFHQLRLEMQYNRNQKTAFKSEFSFVNIALTNQPPPTLELELLEGLKKGKNYLWSLTLSHQLANNVQMNLRYEGRKTGTAVKIVHLGSVEMRASF